MNSKLIVSRLLFLLALVVGLSVGTASFAQTSDRSANPSQERVLEPIAPFVNENTVLVLRIDLNAVDYDRFGETLKTLFNQAIVLAGYSPESVEACNVEFAKTIEALKGDAKKGFEESEKNFGFKSVFFVLQTHKGDGACLIVPAKDMSKEQVDGVVGVLESGGIVKAALYKKSFILASPRPLKELGAFYKNFKSAPNKEFDSFFNANSDKLLTFYASRFKIRPFFALSPEELELKNQVELKATKEEKQREKDIPKAKGGVQQKTWAETQGNTTVRPSTSDRRSFAGSNKPEPKNNDPFADAPQCVRNLIEVFDSSFAGAQGYVDVAGLDFNLTLKFNTAVNSGKFVDCLEDVIDEYSPMFFNELERNLNAEEFEKNASLLGLQEQVSKVSTSFVERYRLAPLWRHMTVGNLKRNLPKSYDTSVVFGGSAVDAMKKVGPNTVFVATFFGALAAFDRQEAWNEVEETKGKTKTAPNDEDFEFDPFGDEEDKSTDSDASGNDAND